MELFKVERKPGESVKIAVGVCIAPKPDITTILYANGAVNGLT